MNVGSDVLRCTTVSCIFVLFVFFFKQKTAYEMRISDWSSDVCSSDLREALWEAVRLGIADVVGSDHAPHSREEKAAPYPRSPSGMPGEIGRASCRERVCQYV